MASSIETATFLSRRSGTFLLLHLECYKVPRVPCKITTAHFLFASRQTPFDDFPIKHGNFTVRTVGHTHTHIPAETYPMSESTKSTTHNDMSTSSDTSRKTRLCAFPHRHCQFSGTTVAHGAHGRLQTIATVADTRKRITGTRVHAQTTQNLSKSFVIPSRKQ